MVIIFQNRQVREHLLEHGKVYTYRKGFEKRKRIGRDWATDRRCGKKIADVDIMVISAITRENLIRVLSQGDDEGSFYEQSGLGTVENWVQAIKDLNRGEGPEYGWLYRVTVPEGGQIHA
ncbi:hypothetical protein H8E65_12180 [Candidatus Bathyarchaeota archaeon]|nr:hypothetical protein [Candidatus Bathyarchaeota archaeon]